MKVRFELPNSSFPAGQADLALLTLGRLVKSGLLPASSKAVDPVDPSVLERFTALNPGKPAPRDLGELLLAYTGDSDADQQLDVDLAALSVTLARRRSVSAATPSTGNTHSARGSSERGLSTGLLRTHTSAPDIARQEPR